MKKILVALLQPLSCLIFVGSPAIALVIFLAIVGDAPRWVTHGLGPLVALLTFYGGAILMGYANNLAWEEGFYDNPGIGCS